MATIFSTFFIMCLPFLAALTPIDTWSSLSAEVGVESTLEDFIDMMMGWRHSAFNVYSGPRIQPGEEDAIENPARYIVDASFSHERMTYIPEESKVFHQSKDG
jgi:hypothetical protein